ncbi:MAG: radical SAM protein [Candidatus Nealsonbacteria bacterium]|nr:radical SAM protein [Candidatus Nealsonbacteria bacterium]
MKTEMSDELTFFWEIVPGNCCNLRCKNCYAAANARPDKRMLGLKSIRTAIDKAISVGMKKIDVLGGEPLLYPHLEEFISYFFSKRPDGFCGVVSNGTLITKERAKSLAKSGVSQISISLDGTDAATHDKNRGKGSFLQSLNGIKNVTDAGIPLTIAYTVTQFNLSDFSNIFPLAEKLGAQAVGIQVTEPFGRARNSLEKQNELNRIEGLKTICQMYRVRSPIYTQVSSRSVFQEFLNKFLNAGLPILPKQCDGGLKTYMVSSGGDLYPCPEYAYSHKGEKIRRGVNLVNDSLKDIKKKISQCYNDFSREQRLAAIKKFTTCKDCKHNDSCAPCAIINSSGRVPECEWVKNESKKLFERILNSKIKLLINPDQEGEKIEFSVPTQEEVIIVPLEEKVFMDLVSSESVAQVIENYMNGNESRRERVANKIIEFLCKLRSHQIIEIDGFSRFLKTDLAPNNH